MTRTYELALVLDPRQSEEEASGYVDQYKTILEEAGATITHEDDWGKRKLAYPIKKLEEGHYLFLYVSAESAPPWAEIERLILQNEKILRHLVVRTDEDLKRALSKGKKPPENPALEAEEGPEEESDESSDSGSEEE